MRGQVALRERDLDRAITCFRAASEAPETRYKGAGRLHEGLALAWKGERDQAVAAFRAAAQAEPESAAGLLASLLAGRLGGGPPETVLVPEDYVESQAGCDVRALDATSLDIDEAARLSRFRLGADLALGVEQHGAPILPRAMVRLVGLAALHAGATGREVRFLVRCELEHGDRAEMFLLAPAVSAPSGAIAPYAQAVDAAWSAIARAVELGRQRREVDDGFIVACGEPLREAMAREWWNDLLEALAREEEDAGASGGDRGDRAKLVRLVAALVGSSAKPPPAAIEGYLRDAQAAASEGHHALASMLFQMHLAHHPDDAAAHAGRAEALAALGRAQAALRALERAGGGPDLLAGRVLLLAGRAEDATRRLQAHVEANADSAEGWELLGLCHAWSGRWATAESCLGTSISCHATGRTLARFHLGYAAWFMGDRVRAHEEWAACAMEAPGSFHGILAVGLSTLRAATASSPAVAAAAERLLAAWRPLTKLAGLGAAAKACSEWLEAARPLGLTEAAFGATLTADLRTRCGDAAAASFLDEALLQADEDAKSGKDEEATARVGLLGLMKKALSAPPR